jgi:3-oxoacyl-[acyl-carrier-protein] synthase-3
MRERHLAAPDQATSDLAREAALRALADAQMGPEDLDLVVCATVTPDFAFPSVSSIVQGQIGATEAGAFDLAIGCTGFLYALATAAGYIMSGLHNNILVIAAESLSRIVNWEDRATCVLFGDGAGAAVLTPCRPGHGFLSFELRSDGTAGHFLRLPGGGSRRPFDQAVLDEKAHLLQMDGHEVYKIAVRGCPEVAEAAIRKAGLTGRDIDWAVMHQANKRIIEAAAKRLELPDSHVFCNVERYGNTSAASIPLALDDLYRAGELREGHRVLMVAFGAGFSLAGSVMEWTK